MFYAVLALQSASAIAAEPRQVRIEGARFVGAAGCKSSSCHGGAGEKRGQYLTWLRRDIHTRGYAILTNARSERMAEALNLPQVQEGLTRAATSIRCTVCHSPLQAIPQARRLPTADPTESVSCESCHGAAEPWLRGHTRTDWTYATRVGAGMRDLKSFYVRANTCVACHQNLDSDITAAGHPELIFEMDGQSVAQPKHWHDPERSGARAWLVGQAVALREMSWRLAQNPDAGEAALTPWNALAWLLNKVTESDRTLLPIEPPTAADAPFTRCQQQADALARRAAQQNFSSEFARRLLRDLVELDSEFNGSTPDRPQALQFHRAQRLLLALECLTSGDKVVSDQLAPLRDDLRSAAAFESAQFAAHLAKFRVSLSAPP